MKILLKIILSAMLLVPIYTHAQFSTKAKIPSNATVKTGVNLSNTPKLTLGKTTLEQVNAQVLDQSISSIPKISLNPEDLERNRVKSWEITPMRPITPGMDIGFSGYFSKTAFYITPILNDRAQGLRFYRAVNLSLITSMLPDKDYRLTIEFENPSEIPDRGVIRFNLGDGVYFLQPDRTKKEGVIVFRNTISAPQIISIGPAVVNDDWQNPKSYGITKLKLEELAPVQ